MKFKMPKVSFSGIKAKLKDSKFKKCLLRGGSFVLVAGCSLFAAYMLTPNRTRTIDGTDYNIPTESDENPTYLNKFLSKVTNGLNDENEVFGLSANINNLEVSWPTTDGTYLNDIKVNGQLNLLIRTLNDIDFSFDVSANYNGYSVDLAIGYVEQTMYFALQDLKIKSTKASTNQFLDYVYQLFFNPENPDGLGIDLNLDTFVDEKLGNFDLSALFSNFEMPKTTEKEVGDNVVISVNIDSINIDIVLRKSDLSLKAINLGEIKIGDVTIKGDLECNIINKVYKLDDPEYFKQRGEFVDSIAYIGWVDRIFDLFKTRKFGFDFAAQVSLDGEEGESKLVDIEGSINIDASQIIDFNNIQLGKEEEDVGRPSTIITDGIDSVTNNFNGSIYNPDGNLEFGVKLVLKGQNGEEYANFDLSYFDRVGYLTFNENESNEATLKAKIDMETISKLITKLPDILADFTSSGESGKKLQKKAAKDTTEDIFAAITNSKLINAINNGDYSAILDLIDDLSNDKDNVYLTVDLSSLGLGEHSKVGMTINNGMSNSSNILSIDVAGVEIGPANISAQLSNGEFDDHNLTHIKNNKDQYDDMAFTTGVLDQVSEILNVEKAKLSLDGSILGEDSEKLLISGKAQFDIGDKVGYGSIGLRQYSSSIANSNGYIDHNVDFDINNNDVNEDTRNMLFSYNKNLKAKITTTTITDIYDLFMDLINSEDERFTKFSDSLLEMLLGSTIATVISQKDFLEFAKPTYLKSVKQSNDGNTLSVVLAGESLGLTGDISINVNFETVENEKHIRSISIENLALLGKTINITLGIEDFDESFTSPINKNDTFMDFSQVKVLLDFGINTTKLSYYHLTASIKVNIVGIDALKFDLDFHIYVNGKTTKVYGLIPDVPSLTVAFSNDPVSCKVWSEFVYEPTSDLKGNFHIVRNEDHLLEKDEVNYYQADTDGFMDGIFSYLLVDMLNLKSSKVESLTNLSISGDKDFDPDFSKMFTNDGFSYYHDADTGMNSWNIGLNLDQITGMSALQTCKVQLNGKDELSSGLFTTADVELKVASLLTVYASIELEDPSSNVYDWPSEIQSKYNTVLGWYKNLTDADKSTFNSQYKNNPLKTYRLVEKRNYF